MRFIGRYLGLVFAALLATAQPALAYSAGQVLNTTGPSTPAVYTAQPTLGVPGTTAGEVKLSGSTSGTTILKASAAAGSATITLPATTGTVALVGGSQGAITVTSINKMAITAPATSSTLAVADGKTFTASNTLTLAGTDGTTMTFPGTSDTVVTLAATQTLTNKTLSASVINGPAPAACGSTCTLSAATAGRPTLLNQAAGSTVTLPAATGTGNKYRMIVTVATTSAAEKILTAPTTDVIVGSAIGENGGTPLMFVGNASTYHSIQMPFAGSKPSGGFIGDEINCTDIASATWQCDVTYQGGTTPTTPYSASTS